jgi:hypothetical protein
MKERAMIMAPDMIAMGMGTTMTVNIITTVMTMGS